jgi:hypothetical protein
LTVSLYDAVRNLELEIEGFATERRETAVSSEFVRVTTTVVLSGRGQVGQGEDVTYQAELHSEFPPLEGRGVMTLDEYSQHVAAYELDGYRRWAFESAALDLALRQRELSLGAAVGREYRPVRFVVSTRLEIRPWLDEYPNLEFKLDPVSDWSDEHMQEVAATGRVRVLDLKGQYEGTPVDQPPDARLYRSVARIFPEGIIEDPKLTAETREALRGSEDRWSWDAPIHSAADIAERDPRFCNIKPSRFGTVERLFDAIDHCNEKGITMYGGGQFELGPGRGQIQALASLFYAEAPNDIAPSDYNIGGPRPGLPQSPLPPRAGTGL